MIANSDVGRVAASRCPVTDFDTTRAAVSVSDKSRAVGGCAGVRSAKASSPGGRSRCRSAEESARYSVIVFDNNSRLERKIDRLERKLDLILRHLQIEDPDPIDFTEIDDLLRRNKKVQAVRRFRKLDPAAGLREAVDAVEAREKTL